MLRSIPPGRYGVLIPSSWFTSRFRRILGLSNKCTRRYRDSPANDAQFSVSTNLSTSLNIWLLTRMPWYSKWQILHSDGKLHSRIWNLIFSIWVKYEAENHFFSYHNALFSRKIHKFLFNFCCSMHILAMHLLEKMEDRWIFTNDKSLIFTNIYNETRYCKKDSFVIHFDEIYIIWFIFFHEKWWYDLIS